MPEKNVRVVLAARPEGKPEARHFRLEEAPVPTPGAGELLLQTRYLSLDPYMRGRMSAAKSYAAPVEVGDVMDGGTVAEVIESRDPGFGTGDVVLAHGGWQRYAVAPAASVRRLDRTQPPSTALGVLGMPGFTAYAGLLTIGRPRAGETVVVAAATGPVGSAVGQIARLQGARAVGIAGGETKRRLLLDTFGFDAAIDHRSPAFREELAAACPGGIDVYFENVGGHVWDAVFPLLNPFARVPVCGLVAQYNDAGPFPGPDRLPLVMRDILSKSITVRGFIQREFAGQRPDFLRDMGGWVASGAVRYLEDVVDGLENAPDAFIGMLEGRNTGKLLVRVSG